ncbi:hypothetical protein [Singulisphaera sp. PoT]|uniref:hypothetical protein n=1 Tax=Singulisphaera sp. PoT TaxID=3411797 RepID=UPI003BF57286
MQFRRWKSGLGTLAAALGLVAGIGQGQARAQVMTVTVGSTGDVLTQLRGVAAGFEGAAPVLQAIDGLENGGLLKGLDRTKPIIATLDLIPQGGIPTGIPVVALFLPTTNQDDLLNGLKTLGLNIDDKPGVEGFSHKLTVGEQNSPPIFLLASPPEGYTIATNLPANAEKLRAMKLEALKPSRASTVRVSLRLDRMPEQVKKLWQANTKQLNDASRQRKDGESDEAHAARVKGIDLTEQAFDALLRDGREFSIDLNIDSKAGKVSSMIGLTAKPDTEMGNAMTTLAGRRSRFSGLFEKSATSLIANFPIGKSMQEPIQEVIKSAREKAKKEQDPEQQKLAEQLVDSIAKTLTSSELDAFFTMDAPAQADGAKDKAGTVVLFGIGMADAKKVESTIREGVAKFGKPDEKEKASFDFAKGDDGTAIHRFTVEPGQMKPEEFGDPYVFAAFPEGAALVAVGGNGLPVIKQALAGLKSPSDPANTAVPPLAFDILATKFAQLNLPEKDKYQAAALETFTGNQQGKDHIRLRLVPMELGAELTLDIDLPVLQFLGKVGAQVKAKGELKPNP